MTRATAALAAILAAATFLAMPAARAADQPDRPRIVVTGEGESAIAPDMAIVSLGVMREAPGAAEAMTANNTEMAAVIAAMREAGIAPRDIQTSGLQITPRYDYTNQPDGRQESRLVAYQVQNGVTIRVRDLAKLGEIIDRSVKLGANQGGGISFTNDDTGATMTEARRKAVEDARAKAETLAAAAGVSLGQVVEISEQVHQPGPVFAKTMRMEAAPAADSVPVEAGENTYRVLVNVTYSIGATP